MKLAFYGMGYLGHAYATWCASLGHEVVTFGQRTDTHKIEPALKDALDEYTSRGTMWHASDHLVSDHGIEKCDAAWLTFDTPISADGSADIEFIKDRVAEFLRFVPAAVTVFISSQIPVGTMRELEQSGRKLAYVPENVRVGRAWEYLKWPDRFVLGTTRPKEDFDVFDLIINNAWAYRPTPIKTYVMAPDAAEMVKHTINAFLGTCISFSNEIGKLWAKLGINSDDVLRGLQSEWRIGRHLPLKPGMPFSTGHIERDLRYISKLGIEMPVLEGVVKTNNLMKSQ